MRVKVTATGEVVTRKVCKYYSCPIREPMLLPSNPYYRGIVDIGSNGVRFSISDLSPRQARVLPTIFSDRAGISLYDAQFSGTTKAPISQEVIDEIVLCMKRFKVVCEEFGVPSNGVRVIATEATREAQNSVYFRDSIKQATGWIVELLSKEDEGRIGAEGVASSFSEVNGLVMDLGGGSTQITWLKSGDGEISMAKKAVSMPYGAAALTKRLETAINKSAIKTIREEVVARIKDAFTSLDLPNDLKEWAEEQGGYNLYLSGGGFRGFGYLLLDKSEIQPYPIPIINGFTAPIKRLEHLADTHLDPDTTKGLQEKFRISERRARQVPAVAFLIDALMEALPKVKQVIFCQGGVREGALYESLSPNIRSQYPITVATAKYAPPHSSSILALLNHALPRSAPYYLRSDLLPALANLLTYHLNVNKETQATAALHCTTSGILAAVHGLTHTNRGMLALALCERWGGEVHDSNLKERFEALVGRENIYWARYIGLIAALIGNVYPAGYVVEEKIRFFALDNLNGIEEKKGKKDDAGAFWLKIEVRENEPSTANIMVRKAIEKIEKVGKKKKSGLAWVKKVTVNIVFM